MPDWSRVIREHGTAVWRTAHRLLENETDVADCFQDTFLSALEVSRREEVRNWSALLRRLATARAIERLRRRVREAGHRDAAVNLDEMVGRERGPTQNAEDAELVQQLRLALAGLPVQQADVFCLRHFEQFSYEEIADQIGISVNKARVLLHRARMRLKRRFELLVV